ncbi:ABC transporter permease [Parabacteroides sp. OttesenSCG-928-J18]|nr:ABC transporter permease [Parabacteroides sp. OttesenSCG-928-J18]
MKIILLAIRSLTHFRLYTLVNILGLGLSLACFILITRFVYSEITTDHYIDNYQKVCISAHEKEDNSNIQLINISGYFSPDPMDDIDIELFSVIYPNERDMITLEETHYTLSSAMVDSNYLNIVSLPILKQNRPRLLIQPNEAIVSEEQAKRLFGNEDPIGKTFTSSLDNVLTVTGVFGKPATKASFGFDILLSNDPRMAKIRGSVCFVRLKENCDIQSFNEKYSKFRKTEYEESRSRPRFYSLKELYFTPGISLFDGSYDKGDMKQLYLLTGMSLLLLLIGLFNFVNIYTVIVLKRGREFGMKKVFGANGHQVALQLYVENFLMAGLALLVGWFLVEIGTLLFGSYLRLEVIPNALFDLTLSLVILFLLPLLTTIFPFVRYNYAPPVVSLRFVGKNGVATLSRDIFLCLQYVITFCLVILSLFFVRQLRFMLNVDPGIQTENIIFVPPVSAPTGSTMAQWNEYNRKSGFIEESLKASPWVVNYTFNNLPSVIPSYMTYVRTPGQKRQEVKNITASGAYFKLLDIQLKEGRLYNDSIDNFRGMDVILNESACELLGITNLENAVVQTDRFLVWYTGIDESQPCEYRVIGIVKDYHVQHLSQKTVPLMFKYYGGGMQNGLLVEHVPGKRQETLGLLQTIFSDISGNAFTYSLFEEEMKALYDADKQLVNILSFFALIAILISIMGLFSLSLFDVQQRFHEIAIRKINGADSGLIMCLLLYKYVKLLGISFLVAAPISWLAITKYLEGFAYKASFAWWLFVVALALTAVVSLLTLVIQIRKATQTNPAVVIRSE